MSRLIYPEESYKIVGACFKVYTVMGCGFLEAVYQECLEIEFEYEAIPFYSQREIRLTYRDHELKQTFKPDFLCYEKIILEIKAISKLADEHRAQILNYLNATKLELGLLVNFGHYPKLEYERLILTEKKQT
jgi:GxxExxY protein